VNVYKLKGRSLSLKRKRGKERGPTRRKKKKTRKNIGSKRDWDSCCNDTYCFTGNRSMSSGDRKRKGSWARRKRRAGEILEKGENGPSFVLRQVESGKRGDPAEKSEAYGKNSDCKRLSTKST